MKEIHNVHSDTQALKKKMLYFQDVLLKCKYRHTNAHTFTHYSFSDYHPIYKQPQDKMIFFLEILKVSSCGNCSNHYVVVKFPANHQIVEVLFQVIYFFIKHYSQMDSIRKSMFLGSRVK